MHPLWGHGRRLAIYFVLWAIVGVLLAYMLIGLGQSPFHAWALANPLVVLYAFASLPVWYTCQALPLSRSLPAALSSQVVAAAVAGGLWALAAAALAYSYGWPPLDPLLLVFLWSAGLLLYGLVVAGYYLALEFERSRAAAQLAHAAELRALKAQINPHFLYNSLNSISALTSADPARAREMCVLLADFLRRTLALSQAGPAALVPLGDELALTRDYLAVEQIRFGARLQVAEDIAAAALACAVPPLLLQPLLENAVVHGISQLPEGGRITLAAAAAEGWLRLEITNPCDPDLRRPRRDGGGVGLQNVHQRLRALFGARARLETTAEDAKFRVSLWLPEKAG